MIAKTRGSINHIFVYGTLKGFRDPRVNLIGEAVVSGSLYDLGPFPAWKRYPEDDRGVIGELYEIQDFDVLEDLDIYEGVPDLYKRVVIDALITNDPNTPVIETYIYEYCRNVEENQHCSNGSWNN